MPDTKQEKQEPRGEAPKLSGARARAAQDDRVEGNNGKYTSDDVFENPSIGLLKNQATVEDPTGVERIVGTSTAQFVPAPMEATDEQKKAAKEREGMFDEAKKARLAALKGEIKDEDRAANAQADGGSQSVPEA